MLMMACTPSSLRMGKAPEEERIADIVSVPKVPVPVLPVDSVSLPALIDSIASRQDVDSVMAQIKDSLEAHPEVAAIAGALADSAAAFDEAPLDTMIPANQESAIKTKRDTTTMDSLELAIYKYNKVIDDSLAATVSTSVVKTVSMRLWNMLPTTHWSTRPAPRGLFFLVVRR